MIKNINSVERLGAILNWQLPTSILLTVHHNVFIALPIVIIMAVLFTPYMLYILIREERIGWIIAFFIIVILPFILFYFFSRNSYAFEGMMLIPFIFFYFYCLLVRLSVNQWIKKYNWHIFYEEQKREDAQRKKWETE